MNAMAMSCRSLSPVPAGLVSCGSTGLAGGAVQSEFDPTASHDVLRGHRGSEVIVPAWRNAQVGRCQLAARPRLQITRLRERSRLIDETRKSMVHISEYI